MSFKLNFAKFIIFLTCIVSLCDKFISVDILPSKNRTKLVTTEKYEIEPNKCLEIIIPNNFKKLLLNLESENLKRVLITDRRVEKCNEDEDLSKCCSKNSTFCIENVMPTKNDFRLNYCIDYTYLYACTFANTFNNQSIQGNDTDLEKSNNTQIFQAPSVGYIFVKTGIIKGQGCHTTEFIPETACSSIGLVSCKDSQKCMQECNYVECRKDAEKADSKVFAMCLPSKLSNEDILNRCRNHVEFEESSPHIYKITCDKKDEDYVPDKSSHSFFKFLLIVMGIIILVTFISSVYYRFKMGMDGIPPFDPPSFTPNFIFPRQSP